MPTYPVVTTINSHLGALGTVTLTVNQWEMSALATTSSLAINLPQGTWQVFAWITAKPTDAQVPTRWSSGTQTFSTGGGVINLPTMQLRTYLQMGTGTVGVAGTVMFGVTVQQQLGSGGWVNYATTWDNETNQSVAIPAAPAARTTGIAWGGDQNWEVYSGTTDVGPFANQASILQQMSTAGATLVRWNIQWWNLCPTGTQGGAAVFNSTAQANYDAFFNALPAGMKIVLPICGNTPAWAATGGTFQAPPANWTDVTNFVTAVLTRWGSKIAAVEGGLNELNTFGASGNTWVPTGGLVSGLSSTGWTLPIVTTQLQKIYAAVKAYNSTIQVGCDALAFADEVFLQAMYNTTGWQGNFDYVSVHPYEIRFDLVGPQGGANYGLGKHKPQTPWGDAIGDRTDLVSGVTLMHKVMAANGDGAKNIYVTEFGWNTTPSGSTSGALTGFDESESQYATNIRTVMRQAARIPQIAVFLIWSYSDTGSYRLGNYGPDLGVGSGTDFFGIVGRLGTRQKPGYTAYKQAISDIAGGLA